MSARNLNDKPCSKFPCNKKVIEGISEEIEKSKIMKEKVWKREIGG